MIGLDVVVLIAATGTATATGVCTGAAPAIVSVAVANVSRSGGLNTYTLAGTVANRGTAGQASNVLQSVDVFQNGNKINSKGIPPLAVGQVYHFTTTFQRSAAASDGTTDFVFRIHMHQPATVPSSANCSTTGDVLKKSF
jgi:hypothetical protein